MVLVPDCLYLDIEMVRSVRWLPETCAYKLIDEGKDLPFWHHLVTHDKESVHKAHISARDKILVHEDDLKLVDEGKDLPSWHHLVSHNRESVHESHISARDKILAHEDDLISDEDYLDYIIGPING